MQSSLTKEKYSVALLVLVLFGTLVLEAALAYGIAFVALPTLIRLGLPPTDRVLWTLFDAVLYLTPIPAFIWVQRRLERWSEQQDGGFEFVCSVIGVVNFIAVIALGCGFVNGIRALLLGAIYGQALQVIIGLAWPGSQPFCGSGGLAYLVILSLFLRVQSWMREIQRSTTGLVRDDLRTGACLREIRFSPASAKRALASWNAALFTLAIIAFITLGVFARLAYIQEQEEFSHAVYSAPPMSSVSAHGPEQLPGEPIPQLKQLMDVLLQRRPN